MFSFNKRGYKVGLSLLLVLLVVMVKITTNSEASTTRYKVYNLTKVGNSIEFGNIIYEDTDFDKAKIEMRKHTNGVIVSDAGLSPLKIVAATRSMAQSYPYRTGKDGAGVTLKIYTTKSLATYTDRTYIPAHYMMYAYDYLLDNGRIIADVEIQGGKGYVEVSKIDIVPMIYIENGIEIMLGGNEEHYASIGQKPEEAYGRTVWQEYYRVEKNGAYNEIRIRSHRTHPGLSDIDLTYGIAPDFLQTGVNYYSSDGIRFFTDRELKNRVGGDYYSYYQWLPLRTMTNYGPEVLAKYLADRVKSIGKRSVMTGETHHFVEQGLKYGMNPSLVFHQANLESAHGTSSIAVSKNNIFGWGAVDSNPGNAGIYSAIGRGVQKHMGTQIAGYTKVSDWRHYGTSFGNKSAGITVKYASDPYYGMKVASLYYRMDKENGLKDYNAYDLSVLQDSRQYSVRNSSTTAEWYKTKSGMVNQVIVNLGKSGNKITTIPWMVNSDGYLDVFSEFAYIEDTNSTITNITRYGPKATLPVRPEEVEKPAEPVYEKPVKAKTTNNLNLRSSYTTTSQIILTIPSGTELTVEPTNVGWARTSYNGQTGFVSMEYLKIEDIESDKPVESKYQLGDVNRNSSLDPGDVAYIRQYLLGIRALDAEQKVLGNVTKKASGDLAPADVAKIRRVLLGLDLGF